MTDLRLEEAFRGHYNVLADGQVVGYILFSDGAPPGTPWMWTGRHEGRTPTHGYEANRHAALQAFSRTWNRG